MKKVLLALIIIAAVGAGVYFVKQNNGGVEPASVLPRDVNVYLDMRNLDDEFEYTAKTRMGKAFASINYKELFNVMDVSQKDVIEILEKFEDVKTAMPFVNQILGECFTISYSSRYLAEINFENKETIAQEILSGVTFVARPKINTSVLTMIDSTVSDKRIIKIETYKGCDIKTVDASNGDNKLNAYYAFTKGLLVITFDVDAVKACIDRSENPQSDSLLNSTKYKEMIGKYDNGYYSFGFVDINSLYSDIKSVALKQSNDLSSLSKDMVVKQFEVADSVYGSYGTISIGEYRKGDVITSTVYATLNEDKMNDFIKAQLSTTQDIVDAASYTTVDTSIHTVSGFEFLEYYNFMLNSGDVDRQMSDMYTNQFKAMMGIEVEGFLKALGTTIGIDVEMIEGTGPFPIPNVALYFKLNSREQVEEIFDKALNMASAMAPVKFEDDVYEGANLKTVLVPMSPVAPTIAYHNDMLFLTSSNSFMKKMIDAKVSGVSLASTPEFVTYTKDNPEAISHVYIQGEKISATLKRLVDFAKGTPQVQIDKKMSYALENVVSPIVDALSMYKVISQTTLKENGAIKVEYKVVMQ